MQTWPNTAKLDTYFKQDKNVVPDILQSVIDYRIRNGKHFGMPNNMSVESIYFNKTLFDKATTAA